MHIARFFLIFVGVLAVGHLLAHLYFYGGEFHFSGIAGFAVDESDVDGEESFRFPLSEIILFFEWALILMGILFVYAKHKIDLKKEYHDLEILKNKMHFTKGTELDNFYELLKRVGHFRLSTAARVFDVDEEIIESWAKSLETGKFAELTYPRIGGPEVRLKKVGQGENDEENDEKEE